MTDDQMLLSVLRASAPDGLLALMLAYRDDPRPDKIDLGLGVYRNEHGITPIMRAVKAAEQKLVNEQETKVYLGVDGDTEFVARLAPIVFGAERAADVRLAGMQTPGGTGALRLAAELLALAREDPVIWIGEPTWANHLPIFRAAGVNVKRHPLFNAQSQTIDMAGMVAALASACPGDALLLHGCCHNPAGIDFTPDEWTEIADVVARRRLLPIVDLAYQGLGRGLEEDAFGTRLLFDQAEALVVAYSCDKNFGLYRERTGALWVRSPSEATLPGIRAAMRNPARTAWSMPPDHGAAVVRIILESDELAALWREELEAMRQRILALREALALSHPRLAALRQQTGMFAMLPISSEAVLELRRAHGIYVADDGRANLAGLREEMIGTLSEALHEFL